MFCVVFWFILTIIIPSLTCDSAQSIDGGRGIREPSFVTTHCHQIMGDQMDMPR